MSRVAVAVAGYGLGGSGLTLPSAPLPSDEWHDLLGTAIQQRLAARLLRCVEDGALPAEPGQVVQAFHASRLETDHRRRVEDELLAVADMLDGRGIEWRVLKGPAHARLGYAQPELRSFVDADVLVSAEQIGAAVERLERAGGARRFPEPRAGFDRRFSKGVTVSMPSGVDVDLHRTLAPGPFGLTVDLPSLFDRTTEFWINGRRLEALGPEERFLHACIHAVLGDPEPRLTPLRDVVELAGAATDSGLVVRLARAWGVDIVVADAVSRAWRTFALDTSPMAPWGGDRAFPRSQRRALAVYRAPYRTSAGQSIAAMAAVRGLRAKVAYGWALLLPRRDERRRSTPERWRRGLRALARRGHE